MASRLLLQKLLNEHLKKERAMKKVAQSFLKNRSKSSTAKGKKKTVQPKRNQLVENARKLLSGDIHFFNKLKEKNMRRRLTVV